MIIGVCFGCCAGMNRNRRENKKFNTRIVYTCGTGVFFWIISVASEMTMVDYGGGYAIQFAAFILIMANCCCAITQFRTTQKKRREVAILLALLIPIIILFFILKLEGIFLLQIGLNLSVFVDRAYIITKQIKPLFMCIMICMNISIFFEVLQAGVYNKKVYLLDLGPLFYAVLIFSLIMSIFLIVISSNANEYTCEYLLKKLKCKNTEGVRSQMQMAMIQSENMQRNNNYGGHGSGRGF
jgi:hypothetical protein